MGVFSSIGEGWQLFKSSINLLFKKPVFLFPIFLAWALVTCIILYMRYYLQFPEGIGLALLTVFLFIFLITSVICIANIIMLELMQQIESGKKLSLSKAMKEAFIIDLIKVIPVALIWAILWFIILIIKVLTSKKKNRNNRPEPSVRDAARTLGGADSGPFSFLKLGLDMIERFIRMVVFLSLPAIAWEDKGPFSALGRSFTIVRKHPLHFLTTYTLTTIAAMFMFIPLVIIFKLDDAGANFSPIFWTGVIIYEGFAWTLGIYLEQMSVGLLYLWHLKWAKKGSKGDLSSVKKPDLLDDTYELA